MPVRALTFIYGIVNIPRKPPINRGRQPHSARAWPGPTCSVGLRGWSRGRRHLGRDRHGVVRGCRKRPARGRDQRHCAATFLRAACADLKPSRKPLGRADHRITSGAAGLVDATEHLAPSNRTPGRLPDPGEVPRHLPARQPPPGIEAAARSPSASAVACVSSALLRSACGWPRPRSPGPRALRFAPFDHQFLSIVSAQPTNGWRLGADMHRGVILAYTAGRARATARGAAVRVRPAFWRVGCRTFLLSMLAVGNNDSTSVSHGLRTEAAFDRKEGQCCWCLSTNLISIFGSSRRICHQSPTATDLLRPSPAARATSVVCPPVAAQIVVSCPPL